MISQFKSQLQLLVKVIVASMPDIAENVVMVNRMGAGDVAQLVECLPGTHTALRSAPSAAYSGCAGVHP